MLSSCNGAKLICWTGESEVDILYSHLGKKKVFLCTPGVNLDLLPFEISIFFTSRLPTKLYKYLPEKAAKHFFEKPEIRFTLSNKLNDPFDLAPVGSYTDSYGAIGVFCLSSTPTSIPMWAHYGDVGRGVVLEFRTDAPFFDEHFPVQVKYKKKRPTVKNPRESLRVKSHEWAYEQEWRCFAELPKDPRFFNQAAQAVCMPFPSDALTTITTDTTRLLLATVLHSYPE